MPAHRCIPYTKRMKNTHVFESSTRNPFFEPSGNSCPVRKLPVELLSYLFGFVLVSYHKEATEDVYADPNPSRDLSYSSNVAKSIARPWLHVSQVCHAWYDAAISTPCLWALIIIPPKSTSPFNRVRMQLERSKDHPLDIRIRMGSTINRTPFIPVLFNMLLTQIHRWRSFDVYDEVPNHLVEILERIPSPSSPIASKLASVRLTFSRGEIWNRVPSKDFVVFGRSAPHLKHITIEGVNVDWNQPWISSASHITALEIKIPHGNGSLSWEQFVTIMHGAPQLEALVFHCPEDSEDLDPAWTDSDLGASREDGLIPIKLLRLRRLDIRLQPIVMVQLFRRCYIPTLVRLTIRPFLDDISTEEDYQQEHQQLERLVAQLVAPLAITNPSSPAQISNIKEWPRSLAASIEHLTILWGTSPMSVAAGIDILYDNTIRVTSLVLDRYSNSAFTDLLFTPTGQLCDVKLPRLQSLTINALLKYWDVRPICALAWQRKALGVPLRELVLRGVREGIPDECVLWFRENLETFYSDPNPDSG